MVVHMPGGGEIVVDSKVPLQAFLEMLDADDDETRDGRSKRMHASCAPTSTNWPARSTGPSSSVRRELVVAFIPGDQLLAAAFEADPDLRNTRIANGILLTTPAR